MRLELIRTLDSLQDSVFVLATLGMTAAMVKIAAHYAEASDWWHFSIAAGCAAAGIAALVWRVASP